jgi:DUF1365 family protein
MTCLDHIKAHTYHGRKGPVSNAFRYAIDYVLIDLAADLHLPRLFSRNRFNLMSLFDSDHGGAPKDGRGLAWARDVLTARNLPGQERILLLAQPRVLGHVFNPVSFWLCLDAQDKLRVVIAEVSNTFGQRHSYLCYKDDLSPITAKYRLRAQKIFHVSPFQPVEGDYRFQFDITAQRIGISIEYLRAGGGLIATLVGPRQPLSNVSILGGFLRRPLGSRRVLALIHWQAVKLWLRKARFRSCPEVPQSDISR